MREGGENDRKQGKRGEKVGVVKDCGETGGKVHLVLSMNIS